MASARLLKSEALFFTLFFRAISRPSPNGLGDEFQDLVHALVDPEQVDSGADAWEDYQPAVGEALPHISL